ncbi:hypothetical protein Droror1_Dr00016552 [Drosera rotundifolia]
MEAAEQDEVAVGQLPAARGGGHTKKRALKNKALSVSFCEKDLKDYVTGFHKRKKKRRKEAKQQQEAAERRKRVEQRKRQKLEREYAIYGVAPPATADGEEQEEDEEIETIPSVSGTALYDNGDIKVTVTTSKISKEEEDNPIKKPAIEASAPSTVATKKHNIPVSKKKPMKKAARQKPRPKKQKRREGKKGKGGKKRR